MEAKVRIRRIVIKNFRAFRDLDVQIDSPVTCIIGENNTGKSALLHAIRLCLDSNLSSTFRSLSLTDINSEVDISVPSHVLVALEITDYAGKTNEEALVGAWETTANVARLIYRFRPRLTVREELETGERAEGDLTLGDYHWELLGGGDSEVELADIDWNDDVGASVRFQDLQSFLVVNLPALRDVESDLRQTRASPLIRLIEATSISDAEKQELVGALEEANDEISESNPIEQLAEDVNRSFNDVAGPAFAMKVDVGVAEPTFQAIVKALRLLLTSSSLKKAEPSSNGLGLNNVLYISILIEYFKKRLSQENTAGQLILCEEPEAHLHPQLQLSLYAALSALPFQSILTTHSTHITAQAGLNRFVALTRMEDGGTTGTVPAQAASLEDDDVQDLERYLDATKSNLLFARRVMLVEGPAEMFLIPALVKKVMGIDLDRVGVSVVPIYGVHFDVYAKMFSEDGMPKRCAIVADGDLKPSDAIDEEMDGDDVPEEPDLDPLESDYVKVFKNATTFERAVTLGGTMEMMIEAARALGANSSATRLQEYWEIIQDADLDEATRKKARRAARDAVLRVAKRYGKARFAQVAARHATLASELPSYIRNSVNWLLEV